MRNLAIAFLFLIAPIAIHAQNNIKVDELLNEIKQIKKELYKTDSINKLLLASIYDNIDKPRYKIYLTENTYNLIKLDTRTGKVWQIQYRAKGVDPVVVNINYTGIVYESNGWDGRFELVSTKNMYTFILLDTGSGETYQVQWGTSSEYRFVEQIK